MENKITPSFHKTNIDTVLGGAPVNKKTKITMEVNEQIFEALRKDYSLRKKICDELGLRETTVASWSYRKQHAKVGFYTVANIIKDHTGLTDEEFFVGLPIHKSLSNN